MADSEFKNSDQQQSSGPSMATLLESLITMAVDLTDTSDRKAMTKTKEYNETNPLAGSHYFANKPTAE